MRIISGSLKSIRIEPPKGLPVRPTTDRAKESLFNILHNHFELDGISVLDLFAGTGNISLEFCSRGALLVHAVDSHAGCVRFIQSIAKQYQLPQLTAYKKDAFTFVSSCMLKYDIIFADAPYALHRILELPALVKAQNILSDKGWLIVEHEAHLEMQSQIGFFDKRTYGQSAFSFFRFDKL